MKARGVFAFSCVLILGVVSAALLLADDDRKHERGVKRSRHAASQPASPAGLAYAETCGGCHFAYQPWLLPAASWEKLLAGLDDHYGNALPLSDEQRQALGAYLRESAAGVAPGKRSRKVLKGLGGQAPLRITELPYIQHKHRKVDAEVFKRRTVGGLGNCPACHTTASQGDYDDDNVRIPQ